MPFIYSDAGSFSEGLAAVKINDKWGFINKKGILVIAATLEGDRLDGFKEGKWFIITGIFLQLVNKIAPVVLSLSKYKTNASISST